MNVLLANGSVIGNSHSDASARVTRDEDYFAAKLLVWVTPFAGFCKQLESKLSQIGNYLVAQLWLLHPAVAACTSKGVHTAIVHAQTDDARHAFLVHNLAVVKEVSDYPGDEFSDTQLEELLSIGRSVQVNTLVCCHVAACYAESDDATLFEGKSLSFDHVHQCTEEDLVRGGRAAAELSAFENIATLAFSSVSQ